jgi:hypothetical protein
MSETSDAAARFELIAVGSVGEAFDPPLEWQGRG